MRLFTSEQERVLALRCLGFTGDPGSCDEAEAEEMLRLLGDVDDDVVDFPAKLTSNP